MSTTAQIDFAAAEEPLTGEKFVISLQENSEMLGMLDGGRTFRFVSPSDVERDYQQESRILTVVGFHLNTAHSGDPPRFIGSLTYRE